MTKQKGGEKKLTFLAKKTDAGKEGKNDWGGEDRDGKEKSKPKRTSVFFNSC